MARPESSPGSADGAASRRLLHDVMSLARRAVPRGSRAAADRLDDLAHETLLRALERPPGDRNINLGPWMQRIFRNLQVDAWRAEARERAFAPDVPRPSAPPGADDATLARERRREIRRAVLALPREQRRALILRFQAGWPFDRIADRLGVEEPTARTRVHRALGILRKRLGTLKAMVMPGTLAFKPALAVLVVLAAEPRGLHRPERASPGVPSATVMARRQNAGRPGYADRAASAPVRLADASDAAPPPVAARRTPSQRTEAARATAARPEPAPAPMKVDFENDNVSGEHPIPWGDWLSGNPPPATHDSLIEIRRQLITEMVKSLEDI